MSQTITAPEGFYLLGTHELVKKGDKFTGDWGAKWEDSGNWCSNNPTQAKGAGWAYARPIPAPVADRQLSDFYVLPADHALRAGVDWVWIPWDRRWMLTNELAGITVGSFSSGFAVCEKYNEPIEGYVWLGAEAVLCKHTDEVMYKGNDKWEDVLGLDGCELCDYIDEYPYARRRIPAPAIADKRGPRPTPPEGYALVEGHGAHAVKGDRFHTLTGWHNSTSYLDTPPTHSPNIWYCRKVEVWDPRGDRPTPPEGYALIEDPNAAVVQGDMYQMHNGDWARSSNWKFGGVAQVEGYWYCRKVEVPDPRGDRPTPPEGFALIEDRKEPVKQGDIYCCYGVWTMSGSFRDPDAKQSVDFWYARKIEVPDPRGDRPTPPEGFALIEDPNATVVQGDIYKLYNGDWVDSSNWNFMGGVQAEGYWYARKIVVPDPRGDRPTPPEGFALIEDPKEPVKQGDMFFISGSWDTSGNFRHADPKQAEEYWYCRPIKQEVSVVEDLEATMPTPEPPKVIKSITPSYIWTKGPLTNAEIIKRWVVIGGTGEFPNNDVAMVYGPNFDGSPQGEFDVIDESVEYWHCFFDLPVFQTKEVLRVEYEYKENPTRTMWAEEKDRPSGFFWKETGRTEVMKVRTK